MGAVLANWKEPTGVKNYDLNYISDEAMVGESFCSKVFLYYLDDITANVTLWVEIIIMYVHRNTLPRLKNIVKLITSAPPRSAANLCVPDSCCHELEDDGTCSRRPEITGDCVKIRSGGGRSATVCEIIFAQVRTKL
jgi:hypothetical protein